MLDNNLADALRVLLYRAGEIMTKTDFSVAEKDGAANIVTTADLAVQEFLVRELSALLPEAGFFCEEEGMADTESQWRWIIDPIDGTTNFARGLDDCAISVALAHAGRTVLGGVYNPYRDEMFFAVAGEGATCNGRPIRVSDRPFEAGLFCTAFAVYYKELASPCAAIMQEVFSQCADFRRYGSCAVELCYLAAGKCDLYFEIRLNPWDFAAACLILEEAGGIVRAVDGNPPPLDRPTPLVGANSEKSYRRLLAIVSRHMSKEGV